MTSADIVTYTCQGTYKTSIGLMNTAHILYLYKDGTVMKTCTVVSQASQFSTTSFAQGKYGVAASGDCSVTFDVEGKANGGHFDFHGNAPFASSSLIYVDDDAPYATTTKTDCTRS